MIKAEWTNADALDLQPTCNQLATDLISRQELTDALTHKWDGMVTSVFDVLKELPSAQPERKTGRWLKAYGEHEAMGIRPFYRYCSRCNEATAFPYKYCPNCGAKMGEEA